MQEITLTGKSRESLGKKDSKKLRREEKIPCVLYGQGDAIHFSAGSKALEKLVHTPEVYIIDIDIDGTVTKAILQDVQYHPVTDEVIHMDFLKVDEESPITVKLPVNLEGNPAGVLQGGKLQTKMRKLRVKGLKKDLPEKLTIDVSQVGLGQSVKIETISFDNIEILEAKNAVVCAVKLTRSAMRSAQEAAEEEK